jgi:hypothetical protein
MRYCHDFRNGYQCRTYGRAWSDCSRGTAAFGVAVVEVCTEGPEHSTECFEACQGSDLLETAEIEVVLLSFEG